MLGRISRTVTGEPLEKAEGQNQKWWIVWALIKAVVSVGVRVIVPLCACGFFVVGGVLLMLVLITLF